MAPRRSAVFLVAAMALAGGCADPDEARLSPFPFWGQRVGMPLDSLEQFFIRQDNMPWGGCDTVGGRFQRCWRGLSFLQARLEAVADSQGRVARMRLDISDHSGGDLIFDNQLSAMERGWFKVKGVRVDDGGVSQQHPIGTVTWSTARGRWTAAVTFDGHTCYGTPQACPVRVELVDHRSGVEAVP